LDEELIVSGFVVVILDLNFTSGLIKLNLLGNLSADWRSLFVRGKPEGFKAAVWIGVVEE